MIAEPRFVKEGWLDFSKPHEGWKLKENAPEWAKKEIEDVMKSSMVLLTFGFVHNQSEAFVRKLPVLMPALMKYRHMFYKNSPSSTSCTA